MPKKKRSRHANAGGPGGAKAELRPAAALATADRKKRTASSRRRLSRAGLAMAAGILVAAAGLVYILVFAGRTKVRRDSRLNVLLITLDTTRADRLGAYGHARAKTPNLDSLARNGVRFENVLCQVPLTLPSHCSIMTGTYPFSHKVHDNGTYELGPDHLTVAKVLKEKGFRTAAVVASFSVDSRFGLARGFDFYDDDIQPGLPFKPMNSERKGEEVVKAFSSWVDKAGGEPFFAWVHFSTPTCLTSRPLRSKRNSPPTLTTARSLTWTRTSAR